MKMLSTGLPKNLLILMANGVDGRNRFFSIATIVCRLTPTAAASCCWVISNSARSTFILFFIFTHHIVSVHFQSKVANEKNWKKHKINNCKPKEADPIY